MWTTRTMTWRPTVTVLLVWLHSCQVLGSITSGGPRVGSMEPNVGTAGNVGGSLVSVFLEHDPLALTEFPPEELTRISDKEDRPGMGVFQVERARVPALCKFDEEEVEGVYVPGMAGHSRVICRTPPLDVGTSEVRVSLDGTEFSTNFAKYTVLFTAEATDLFGEGDSSVRRSLIDIPTTALAPGPSTADNFYGFYGLSPGGAPDPWEWPEMTAPSASPSGMEGRSTLEQAHLRADINPDDLEEARSHGLMGKPAFRSRSDLEEFETCIFAVARAGKQRAKVVLGLAGSIPTGFQEFYCRFGSEVAPAEKVLPPDTLHGPTLVTCVVPPRLISSDEALLRVQISTDGMTWTPGGPLLKYTVDGLVAVDVGGGNVEPTRAMKFQYLPYSPENCVVTSVVTDGNLAELSSLRVAGAVIDPEFDPAVRKYSVEVLEMQGGGSVAVTADAVRGSGASVGVNGEPRGLQVSSLPLRLPRGRHAIPVSVTSRNGRVTNVYTLNVNVVAPVYTSVVGPGDDMPVRPEEQTSENGMTKGDALGDELANGKDLEEFGKSSAMLEGEPDDLVHQEFSVAVRSGDLQKAAEFAAAFARTFGGSARPSDVGAGTVPGPCDINEDFANLNEAVIAGTLQLLSDAHPSTSGLSRTACALQLASLESSDLTHTSRDALRGFLHSRIRTALSPPQARGLPTHTAKCMLGLVSNLMRAAESDRRCNAARRARTGVPISAFDPMAELMHLPSSIARAVLLQPAPAGNHEAARMVFADRNLALLAAQVTKGEEDEETGFVGRAGPVTCAMQVTDDSLAVGQKVHIIAYAFSGLNPLPSDVARGMKGEHVVVMSVESESGTAVSADVLVRTASQLLQPWPQFQGLRIWSQGSTDMGQRILSLLSSQGNKLSSIRTMLHSTYGWLFSLAAPPQGGKRTARIFVSYSPTRLLIGLQYVGLFLCIASIIAWSTTRAVESEPLRRDPTLPPPSRPPSHSSGLPQYPSRNPPVFTQFPLTVTTPLLSKPAEPHFADEESGLPPISSMSP